MCVCVCVCEHWITFHWLWSWLHSLSHLYIFSSLGTCLSCRWLKVHPQVGWGSSLAQISFYPWLKYLPPSSFASTQLHTHTLSLSTSLSLYLSLSLIFVPTISLHNFLIAFFPPVCLYWWSFRRCRCCCCGGELSMSTKWPFHVN